MKTKVYPLGRDKQGWLLKELKDQEERGLIRKSSSPFATPVFVIKKKNGTFWLIMDYRMLNNVTIKNKYPLPLIKAILNQIQGAKYFTKFDVCWGYHNIWIKEGDKWKAAFVTSDGLFESTVMMFRLTNAPATFQGLMNQIFANLITRGRVAVYLDDILIFTSTLEEHCEIV